MTKVGKKSKPHDYPSYIYYISMNSATAGNSVYKDVKPNILQ